MPVLKTGGLTKVYREKVVSLADRRLNLRDRMEFRALDGVSLTLESGRIYGLVGNNGAGKTTLMRVIAGLTPPTAGSISLFGAETEKELFAARQRIGFLIARPAGYEEISLWQNLVSQAMLMPGVTRQELSALCELAGLDRSVRHRLLGKASTGERQRYGLASALMGRPELLLLDEPMNGLDPRGIADTRELILELNRERGMTVLISSHLLAELHRAATDYIFLHRGRVLETLTAAELDERIGERKLRSVEDYFLALVKSAKEHSL
jgi:ABC-2 type transport system ATP-binding protein